MASSVHISCAYALGDAVCLTGAVRDLHLSHPDLRIIVHPPFLDLWENIPFQVEISRQHYTGPDIRPIYPLTEHLVAASRSAITAVYPDLPIRPGVDVGTVAGPFVRVVAEPYWVVVAGGVHGVETKWWPHWPALAEGLRARLAPSHRPSIVQVGGKGDWHPSLPGVIDRVGQTTIRELAAILYHASGLICPITSAMHLIRAVGNMAPMIVLAGGREPPAVFRYPNQTVLHHTPDDLPCAECWLSRCKLLPSDRNASFAPCMSAITPADVLSQFP